MSYSVTGHEFTVNELRLYIKKVSLNRNPPLYKTRLCIVWLRKMLKQLAGT